MNIEKTVTPIEGLSFQFHYDSEVIAEACGQAATRAVAQLLLFIELSALRATGFISSAAEATQSAAKSVHSSTVRTIGAGWSEVKMLAKAARFYLNAHVHNHVTFPTLMAIRKAKEVYAKTYIDTFRFLYSPELRQLSASL